MARIKPNRLNWNLLKAFLGIVEYRTLADAARAAGVQRPTISEKLSALEAVLELQLIERQPGNDRLRLTPEGERLRRLLVEFDRELALLCKPRGAESHAHDAAAILREVEEAMSALERVRKVLEKG